MKDGFQIRQVREEDWRQLRELRLAALADPVASVAFTERYEVAAARPDSFWRQRAAQGRTGRTDDGWPVTTFAAAPVPADTDDARWAGMLTVVVQDGTASVVGVYLRPEHRGSGLGGELFRAAEEWAWARDDVERLQLHVHEQNHRARAFYERLGFVPTGESDPHHRPPYGRAHVYVRERASVRAGG
ncbi:GNAT family N-acetyltransferase [Streptomyces armeniacus]|uniref:GNAT family N-acetyltransferase n=1 Tax=Streptomyces armeniacus TaxID=83291 RepID=A0A345XZ81_9ACTN|nr:GNAT family N-acetyltransferase [Streptomyces armeniacus]AXK36947.1 GNAT family N-acetyltransferase [Streptomyces armeniacus]